MESTTILSIIIVNWNTKDLLEQCLQAIVLHIGDLHYEVVVVDNGSTDGSAQMVREYYPNVTLIENQENTGFAKANNQAIRLSSGRYILLLNSDAFLSPNATQRMIQIMEDDPSIGIAGAMLEYPDGRIQVSHGSLPDFRSELLSLFGLDKFHEPVRSSEEYFETGTVNGAGMLIRKSLIDRIGLLDESFFMFSEEVDLCNRCHKAGAKVVHVPSAIIIHLEAGSTGQTVQRVIRLYKGKLHYFHKYYGSKAEARLRRAMLVSAKVKSIVYSFIRLFSLGKFKKDEFWRSVSNELLNSIE